MSPLLIPSEVAGLLVAYFCHTATEAQRRLLDQWVGESEENMGVFEACLEESLKLVCFDPDRAEEYVTTLGNNFN